jgi:TP901 family phage tail tape measure protein
MSTIGFDDLFNKSDFNSGLEALKNAIAAITKEIESTKTAADGFSKTMGEELKNKINQLSSASSNFDTELKKVRADFEAFKQSVGQTNATLDQYKKTNEDLTNKVKNLEEQTKKYTTAQQGASKAASEGGITMKGLSQQLLGVASGAALVYKGISMLKEQINEAVKSSIEFAAAMKQVEAISRANSTQISQLTKDAQRLGASTEKTAVQIANTQKELAKLGFTVTEILAATDGIIDLSTATGEGLAQSATVAAATLRAFGLEAEQMTRVVDVMAGSFVRSGLDLEKFREAMKLVAPIARATNIDIETTTASLSKLADAGLSGSLAGTALRNLFSSMADPTDKLSKFLGYTVTNSQDLIRAFKDLRDRGVDLAQAVQMVDVRARPAFFTLLNQIDAVEELALQYRYLDGEAKKIATTIREELNISIDIANSAFDAFRRELVDGFMPAMKDGVEGLTSFIDGMRLLVKAYKDGTLAQEGFFGSAIFYYAKFLETVNPLNILATYLGYVGDAYDLLNEKVGGGLPFTGAETEARAFRYALEDIIVSVDSTVTSIEEGSSTLESFTLATQTVAEGCDELSISLAQLKNEYPELNELVLKENKGLENNADFLGLVIIKQKEKLRQTAAEIKSLEAQEKATEDLIKAEKEGSNNAERLAKAERVLKTIRDARANSSALLLEIEKALAKVTKDLADEEERIATEQKLITINGQYRTALAKTAEEEAKIRLDRAKGLDSEMDRAKDYKDARIRSINAVLQAELEAIGQSGDAQEIRDVKVLIAREKYKQSAIKIEQDLVKNLVKITSEAYDKIDEEDEKLLNARIERANRLVKAYENAYKDIIKLTDQPPVTEQAWRNVSSEMEHFRKTRKQGFQEYFGMLMEQKGLLAKAEEQNDNLSDAEMDRLLELTDNLGNLQQLTKQALGTGLREIGRGITMIYDNAAQRRENELTAIDKWEEERIKLAGDNQEAIAAIEEEAEQRRNKIRLEQAKADRREALFQIAIQTAINIVKVFPNALGMIAAGILGAAQAAIVASKPLPQFAKGTTNAPEGQAIVGEKGREIVWDKRSNTTYVTPDAPTLTYLSKGSVVIPNDQTERILSTKVDRNEIAYDKSTPTSSKSKGGIDYNRLGSTFEKAVTKIPLHQTTFDADGVREFVKRGNNRTERLNRRYKY